MLFRTAFPDIHFTVDNILAEGDDVAVKYTFRGTHRGRFGELEPTGRTIDISGVLIARLRDSRIETAFSAFDTTEMLSQLAPPAPAA